MAIAILLPCPISGHYISTAQAPTREIKEYSNIELIDYFAKKYNIDKTMFLKVAKCESKLNPKAIHYNDGGKGKHSVGIFQFQEKTFLTWEKKLGEDLNYGSAFDQIKLASFMWSKGQQNQWSCYRMLKK